MVLGITYLSVNLITLGILAWRRYWQYYPIFCVALATTCWQAGARLFVITDPIPGISKELWAQLSRDSWMHRWAPGEYLLLIATGMALLEGVWRSVERLTPFWREITVGSLALMAGGVAVAVHTAFHGGDWYDQLLFVRVWAFVAFLVFAIAAWGVGYTMNRNREWPRAARMHLTLYTCLMVALCWFNDWTAWRLSGTCFRLSEMVCCAGWVMNAEFRVKDLRDALRSLHVGDLTAPRSVLRASAHRTAHPRSF
jgi:hypothetical protein